jgi:quercetin dioxygenase-like cupin family protein
MNLSSSRVAVLGLALITLAAGSRSVHASPVGVARSADLSWTDAGPDLPGGTQMAVLVGDPSKAEAFTVRIKFPAGTRVMPHVHPATEHVTVVKGRLGIGSGETWDDAKLEWLTRGDAFWVEKGAPHFGSAKSEVIIEIHATGPWGLTYVEPPKDR